MTPAQPTTYLLSLPESPEHLPFGAQFSAMKSYSKMFATRIVHSA
jgi:predicted DNA-binding protein (MmcQ/YjbR family)